VVVRFGKERDGVWVREGGGVWKRKVSVIDALLSAIAMVDRVLQRQCCPVVVY